MWAYDIAYGLPIVLLRENKYPYEPLCLYSITPTALPWRFEHKKREKTRREPAKRALRVTRDLKTSISDRHHKIVLVLTVPPPQHTSSSYSHTFSRHPKRDRIMAKMMKMKKNVDFKRAVMVVQGKCQEGVSDEEIWFTQAEFQEMRRCDRKLANALSKGIDGITYIQGLETRDQRTKRRARMKAAKLSVLLEQEKQFEARGPRDPAKIALEYSRCTRGSRREAAQRAKRNVRSIQDQKNSSSTQRNKSRTSTTIASSGGDVVGVVPEFGGMKYHPMTTISLTEARRHPYTTCQLSSRSPKRRLLLRLLRTAPDQERE
jgi:hypothetical protein